jgi:hypothetical protein
LIPESDEALEEGQHLAGREEDRGSAHWGLRGAISLEPAPVREAEHEIRLFALFAPDGLDERSLLPLAGATNESANGIGAKRLHQQSFEDDLYRLSPASLGDAPVLSCSLVEHIDEFEEVRLPGAVDANEGVDARRKLKTSVLEGREPLNREPYQRHA